MKGACTLARYVVSSTHFATPYAPTAQPSKEIGPLSRLLFAKLQGKIGVCIAKSKQAILIGHHPEHAQAGNATQTVQALADYLVGVGY